MCKCYIKLCSQHLKCDHMELLLAECYSLSEASQANAAFAGLFFTFSLAQDFEDPSSNDPSEMLLVVICSEGDPFFDGKELEKKCMFCLFC